MQIRTRRSHSRHRRQRPLHRGIAAAAGVAAVASALSVPAVVNALDSTDVSDASANISTGLAETTLSSLPERDVRVSRAAAREAQPAKIARQVVIKEKPEPPPPPPPPAAVLPISGYDITSQFGDVSGLWSSGSHTGLDFAAATGTPIRAIKGGTVTEAGWDGAYGYKTVVQLPDGSELWYCHQDTIAVSVGQGVGTGQVIGTVGATGNVTGPHLHLEYRPSPETPADPAAAMASWGVSPY